MDSFLRRWKLIKLLLTGPKLRSELLDTLVRDQGSDDEKGLSEGTLSTDIKALREMGIGMRPLAAEDKKTKQPYALDMALLDLFVTPEEAAAIQAAATLFDELQLPEASLLNLLFERVPTEVRDVVTVPSTEGILERAGTQYDPAVISRLQEGIRTGRMMRISYQAIHREPRNYSIDGARLVWLDGFLYLHAHYPGGGGPTVWHDNREFRLDRFRARGNEPIVEILETPVSNPELPSFEYQLWLPPDWAAAFRRIPEKTRLIEERPDGSRIIAIKETIPLRAARKILSYGGQARVVEPDFVVAEVRSMIERMAAKLQLDDNSRGENASDLERSAFQI